MSLKSFEKKGKKNKISSKFKVSSLVNHLLKLLESKNFFKPHEKKQSMITNINNLIYRLEPNDKELRILASIISSLSKKLWANDNWQINLKPYKHLSKKNDKKT